MRRLAAIVVAALALPAAAAAHVEISPPFVEDGVETRIALAAPNERPPHATVTLRATAPAGLTVISAGAPAGWTAAVNGSTVTWTGGRLEDRESASFPIRIVARVRAGTYAFTSVQTYDDGATVRWTADLSVLPASGAASPAQHPWGALAATIAGIVVIGGSMLALRLLRRRSLQER